MGLGWLLTRRQTFSIILILTSKDDRGRVDTVRGDIIRRMRQIDGGSKLRTDGMRILSSKSIGERVLRWMIDG